MKTILIATDFSTAARNAALYGWGLAKAMNAKAILFTAYQVPAQIGSLNVHVSHFDVMKQTQTKLVAEADAIILDPGLQLEMICDEGPVPETILALAKEKGADLIIAGMKGSGKNLKKIFGSTAIALTKASTIPIIIVPEEAVFTTPKNILYASDAFMDITIWAIDQVKWLTDIFSSKLFVVRVVADTYEEVREKVNTPQNLRKELKKLGTTFNFPINNNITDGLNEFIKEQPVDLMVMSPHKHEWLEKLFVKSETKDMVFHTQVPLLLLPPTAVEVTNTEAFQAIENYAADL